MSIIIFGCPQGTDPIVGNARTCTFDILATSGHKVRFGDWVRPLITAFLPVISCHSKCP